MKIKNSKPSYHLKDLNMKYRIFFAVAAIGFLGAEMTLEAKAQPQKLQVEIPPASNRTVTAKGTVCTTDTNVKAGFVASELSANGVQWSDIKKCDVLIFPPVTKPSKEDLSTLRKMLNAEKKIVLDAYIDSDSERKRIQLLSHQLVGAHIDADSVVISKSLVGQSLSMTPLYHESTIDKELSTPGALSEEIVNNNPKNYFNLNQSWRKL